MPQLIGLVTALALAALPAVAGPPTWSSPWSIVAYLPAILIGAAHILTVAVMVRAGIVQVLLRRHSVPLRDVDLDGYLFVIMGGGGLVGLVLGGGEWAMVGMMAGVLLGWLPLYVGGNVQRSMVTHEWLHEKRRGCCLVG